MEVLETQASIDLQPYLMSKGYQVLAVTAANVVVTTDFGKDCRAAL